MDLLINTYQPPQQRLIRQAYRLADEYGALSSTKLGGTTSLYNGPETAQMLIDWQLDGATVAASLLVPVVYIVQQEDGQPIQQIDQTVIALAGSVLQLAELNSRLARTPKYELTPRNMQELLLAESRDMRTLIVWLATRIVALRLQDNRSRQRLIAQRCRDIYAGVADLLGMDRVKSEMETYSFRILEPARYKELEKVVQRKRKQIDRYVAKAKFELKQLLEAGGLPDATVEGRSKDLYSIDKKLHKAATIDAIYDLAALRVIVPTVADCYRALSVIHEVWQPLEGRIKDYIAQPKSNGYRSLHTTVASLKNQTVEIQIRTPQMHEEAETGLAAHFHYDAFKGTKAYQHGSHQTEAGRTVANITRLHDVLHGKEVANPNKLRLNLYRDQIYVFSPDGDVYKLPAGAVALDFAFVVHTDIGLRTKAIYVNGAIAKLDRPLANGETVRVVTQKQPHPHQDWLNIVITAKAKHKIRSWRQRQLTPR